MFLRRDSLLLLLILSPPAPGGPGPRTEDPRAVLETAAAAIGGLERLRRLGPLRVEESGIEYMLGTPSSPAMPRLIVLKTSSQLRDHARRTIRWTVDSRWPMRSAPVHQVSLADDSVGASMAGAQMVPDTRAGWRAARAELALAPEQVLLTALAAPDLREEPDSVIAGQPVRRVSFGFDGDRIELTVSARSGFPLRVATKGTAATDPFTAMWGDLRIVTTWTAWALDSTGVWYPRLRSLTLNGEPWRQFVVTGLTLDAPAEADSFSVSDSVASAFRARLGAGPAAAPLTPQPFGRDAVLYFGGYQSWAVRQSDGIVVVEAPESNAKAREILRDLATRWPGIPVKALIATSPMWMHLGGVREYVARGIPIYATPGVGEMIRRMIRAPHTTAPDSLARAPRAPRLTTIETSFALGQGSAVLRLIPAPGPHGASMLLVYQPMRRLLYGSDVLVPDAFEPVFRLAHRAEMIASVNSLGLPVDSVFGIHVAPGPWSAVLAGDEVAAARAAR